MVQKQIIQENLAYHEDYEGFLGGDHTESNTFKEVRGSVFRTSELEFESSKDEPSKPVSPELKFKRDSVKAKQQSSKERVASQASQQREDSKKPNRLNLVLDIEEITNEHELRNQQSIGAQGSGQEDRSENMGTAGLKTP